MRISVKNRPLWLRVGLLATGSAATGVVVVMSGAALVGWVLVAVAMAVAFGAAVTEQRWETSRTMWQARQQELEQLRQELLTQNEELRASADALEGERQRLRDIVSSMGVGAAIVGADGEVAWTNELMREWFGHPTDPACAPLYLELVWPARVDAGSPVQKALLSGEMSEGHRTAETVNGTRREFQLICSPMYGSTEETDTVLMLVQDVTGARRAEQEVRDTLALLNNILESTTHSAIVASDDRLSILAYNSGAETVFGMARSQAMGRNVAEMHQAIGIDPAHLEKAVESAGATGVGSYAVCVETAGGRRFLVGDATVMRDAAGEEKGYVFLVRDVTREREMADDLRTAKDQAENAYADLKEAEAQLLQSEKLASLGQLAAGVAHEINNPVGFVSSNISTLSGYISSLQGYVDRGRKLAEAATSGENASAIASELSAYDEEADIGYILEDVSDLLAETQDGLERVRKIVLDLKSFCRADDAERKAADINAGLESTLNVVWNELKYKAEVVREYGDIPEIECYPMQLNQVFMNMLVNAAHAIPEHGTITISTCADGEDHVIVRIGDTGTGMTEEVRSKVFDPFFTTKEVGKGTGLGLSMAYGIIEKHGGTIDLETEVGVGTTFIIRLPVAMPAGVAEEAAANG